MTARNLKVTTTQRKSSIKPFTNCTKSKLMSSELKPKLRRSASAEDIGERRPPSDEILNSSFSIVEDNYLTRSRHNGSNYAGSVHADDRK